MSKFKSDKDIFVLFAHANYQLDIGFKKLNPSQKSFQVYNYNDLINNIDNADVLVISGLWQNELIEKAKNLKYIQLTGVGYDGYDLNKLKKNNIKLCNAVGLNRIVVAEHTISLILALSRFLHIARDNQLKKYWAPFISDPLERQSEINGKTVVIFGLGDIGNTIAKFCKNFEMNVIGIKRDTSTKSEYTDKLLHTSKFHEAVKEADFLVISSSLNEETNQIIDKKVFNNMKETSYLVNVARGGCVNEQDLIEALNNNKIKGAALDHLSTEPLDINNPLWDFENVIITPHTAGETPNYETVIPEILIENIEHLKNDNDNLLHRVV